MSFMSREDLSPNNDFKILLKFMMIFYNFTIYNLQFAENGCKVTKYICNHQRKCQNNSSVGQNNGSDEQALGARIRMVFAMVGAMRSMVTGVFTRSAFVPAP